ncbi:metal-dependent hydrolase [Desulfovibrio porci]|uniref:metal-dependent hydrolase n=1 Tax=Desulfovibrio porci TaxID=2605782 RepID=UPI002A840157|nr:metal-dependent hydrolase [Desulfovibrio porci]MDY3808906.1 metal-dependent hydrolase [Desulfovibrio porci]
MSEITWYGHSAFKISAPQAHVLIDPFFTPASGVTVESLGPVDMLLVTHDHGDHVGEAVNICRKTGAMLGAIVGTAGKLAEDGVPEAQILNGIGFNMGGTMEHKGIKATMTQAFHSSDSGAPAGYIIEMPDGLVVYHAGDTCIFSGMELWGQLYHIDVALLPIGGVFTMDARQAALACKLLGCKSVIPMHWGTFPVLAQSAEYFQEQVAKLCPDCDCIAMRPGQSLSFV